MNSQRGQEEYSISLDLGNGSVGWTAMKTNYRLKRAKGHELIGARLFEPAETAEGRRMYRTTRRRLSRRKWRLRLLDSMFDAELSAKDPSFLVRRKYSWVNPKDEANAKNWYGGRIFDTREQDIAFYDKYPTIYHLRRELMQDTSRHDIREVYLAIHHIAKSRGHFLTEGDLDSSNVFQVEDVVSILNQVLQRIAADTDEDYSVEEESLVDCNADEFEKVFTSAYGSRSWRSEQAMQQLTLKNTDANSKRAVSAILKGLQGNQLDLTLVFSKSEISDEQKKMLRINFSDADYESAEESLRSSGLLDEEEWDLFEKIKACYSAVSIKRILGKQTTISAAMCAKYSKHHQHWTLIKEKLRTRENAEEINRNYGYMLGWEYDSGKKYQKKLSGNDLDTKRKKAQKFFQSLFESSTLSESVKQELLDSLEAGELFPVQRGTDNGVIPHQLHLNELRAIARNQGKYYPFLLDTFVKEGKETLKLEELVFFRIPYYVGPLVAPEDMNTSDNSENHWMVRKSNEAITPWNFNDVVDKDASGRKFIERLVETDTYLLGEPTLPKHSLLYQEFEVLNELNNVRFAERSGNHWANRKRQRLGKEEKALLLDLFKQHQSVTKKQAEKALTAAYGHQYELFGLSDETKFSSSLSSYYVLSRIFNSKPGFVESHRDLMEEIIELQTVFEDKKTLKHQLDLLDGLQEDERKMLMNIHYTGWGKLSKKLLTSRVGTSKLGDDFMPVKHSIIEVLRDKTLNFMEIISDDSFGFGKWINDCNTGVEDADDIDDIIADLRVSPKAKRGITQSMRVIDDIIDALNGQEPANIFIELADEVQSSQRTVSRLSRLNELYSNKTLKNEFKEIIASLKRCTNDDLQDDRLFLYYTQLGRDMYTGEPLDIDRLSSAYDIDHIVPQSVTQDDSLDNRVLVARAENARKTDSFQFVPEIANNKTVLNFWEKLLDLKLISQRKYDLLTRKDAFSERERSRFVARSLVETRQIMKNVSLILRMKYPNTNVIGLNAALTSQMRRYLGYSHKNRDINDYHHAQDALCIGAVGQFAVNRGFFERGQVSDGALNTYNMYLQDYLRSYRESLQSKGMKRGNPFGFIVGSMRSIDDRLRTNPITGEIVWSEADADYLRKVMEYRKMLVTRKIEDKYAALYDETRYGRNDKKGDIPFDSKKANTSLYGGFSSTKTAYCVLIETKKGDIRLVNVPVRDYVAIEKNGEPALREVLSRNKKFVDARILLKHVHIGQLIRYRGALMTIKSASELNTAWQLWLPHNTYDSLDSYLSGKRQFSAEEVTNLLTALIVAVQKYYPCHRLNNEDIPKVISKFGLLPNGEKVMTLRNIVASLHADARRSNLAAIGLGSEWKRMKNATGYSLSDDDSFIFQSASGVRTRIVTVGELRQRHL